MQVVTFAFFHHYVKAWSGGAEAKNISFESSIDSNLPPCVAGGKAKLTQVLNNLLANGCKFTEKGGVHLLVELAHSDAVSASVTFTISDTGIGIEPEEIQHIFQPFRQVDSSMNRKFGGTGLGLTIAERIVQLMGGTIHVNSQKDKGTVCRFTPTFPLAVFLSTADPSSETRAKQSHWLRPPRVLLVEDIKFDSADEVRKYLNMILQETRKETARLRKRK